MFTFGIGEGASTALINGMARVGNGKAEFVTESQTDLLQMKVSSCLLIIISATFVYNNEIKMQVISAFVNKNKIKMRIEFQ